MTRIIAGLKALSTLKKVTGAITASLIATVISTWLFEIGGIWITVGTGVWSGVNWGWGLLQAPYLVPGWLVLLLGFLALLSLVGIICFIVLALISALRPTKIESQTFMSYTEDMIDGVRWRWRWLRRSNSNEAKVDNLWCFCPDCDAQLVYASYAGRNGETLLLCERCPPVASDETYYDFRPTTQGIGRMGRVKATTIGRTGDEIRAPIEREILRRIRTETYQRGI